MAITETIFKNLIQLAALGERVGPTAQLTEEIGEIMDFVEQLRQVPTDEVAPLFHPLDLPQRLRQDKITESDCSAQLAAIAPHFENGLYLVPKVID